MKSHVDFKRFRFFGLGLVVMLIGCNRELDEPYKGYFFIQNTGGVVYTLYINDKEIGDVEETDIMPILCVDSTLNQTTQVPITHRKNDFVLIDERGDFVTNGSFKIHNDGTSSESLSTLGNTRVEFFESRVIVGFNLDDSLALGNTSQDCL